MKMRHNILHESPDTLTIKFVRGGVDVIAVLIKHHFTASLINGTQNMLVPEVPERVRSISWSAKHNGSA